VREPYFERLATNLAEQGVSARYIDRLVAELEDHCADAAAEQGIAACPATPSEWPRDRLGDAAAIVSQVVARPELRGRLSSCRVALRMLGSHGGGLAIRLGDTSMAGPVVMRWSASIACGATLTAALLLAMAQSIALNV
jgi:hypothetical protein